MLTCSSKLLVHEGKIHIHQRGIVLGLGLAIVLDSGTAIASQWIPPVEFENPAVEPGGPSNPKPESSSQPENPELEEASPSDSEVSTDAPDVESDTSESPSSTELLASEGEREVIVHSHDAQRNESRGVADVKIERDVLNAAPKQEGAEVLRLAPGVYIGRAEGSAVAHNYMLRGFDADHGQDIEFRVGDLPINLPAHLHGQGYADLGFLIGDVIQEVQVQEGVYDPRQGDFAVAGSISLSLGVPEAERGILIRSGYGRFNTFRQLARWAPKGQADESFGAVQLSRSDGFGQNRAGRSGSGIFQHSFGKDNSRFQHRVVGIVHAARSDMAGVLRREDVDSGAHCWDCVYPYASAKAQNASTQRVLAGYFSDYRSDMGDSGRFGIWFGRDHFRIQQNLTGFIQRSQTLEGTSGRGDLIEQQNKTLSIGVTGRYRTPAWKLAKRARVRLELGSDSRLDTIDQQQNLLDASVRNQTWDERVDAKVRALDLGLWADSDWRLTRFVNLRVGGRADLLSYELEDALGNFAPLTRPEDSYIVSFRRSAMGVAAGPRTSFELQPLPWLSFLVAYGEGYRSPQARQLEDGERSPFTKVRSADGGVRLDLGNPLQLALGAYYTRLSDDLAFDADEGRLERVGASQRLGATAHLSSRPLDWLIASFSATYVQATLLEPPPATAEEPDPPFVSGQALPFVPPLVLRGDLATNFEVVPKLGRYPLDAKIGLGFSYLSRRPLPYGDAASPFALLDTSIAAMWGPLDLSFEVFNLADSQYAAMEYNFASDWNPDDGFRPRTPARHFSAGAPRSWMLSLGVRL